MKKIAKTIMLVFAASVFFTACTKSREAFNAKLKIGAKDGIDVLTPCYCSPSDTTRRTTP